MKTLYIVATPIGNLEDITFRAIRILKEMDLIACEDTRETIKLLNRYAIKRPLVSYHQHSKISKIDYLIQKLKNGKSIAVVTDSGTPGISDPGQILIAKAIEQGIKVVPIPGPSAITCALSVAGLPTNNFLFLGFLPLKKGRKKLIESITQEERTVVFYESPHRIIKTLEELKIVLDKKRQIVLCRELTKIFEEIIRGNISEVIKKLTPENTRGEFVVIVGSRK